MIKGHHTFLLRKLFSTSKNSKVSPRNVVNKTKISPTPSFVSDKNRQHCPCKRRRKDIDKIILKKEKSFPMSS